MAKLTINRTKRRILHRVWPKLITGPVGEVASELDHLLRTEGEGMTPGEIEYCRERIETLKQVSEDLHKIYFRLKF